MKMAANSAKASDVCARVAAKFASIPRQLGEEESAETDH